MIPKPSANEWDMSLLPTKRLAYLDASFDFEDIVARTGRELRVVSCRLEPYKDPPARELRAARQVVFRIQVSEETCDLLWNARDGLRGRYWQSPEVGDEATRRLIAAIASELLVHAKRNHPLPKGKAAAMSFWEIDASLQASSAKVWPLEKDGNDVLLLKQELRVPRWEQNEAHAEWNKGEWRKTPTTGLLEVKGGILGVDGTEHVPPGKRDRACQIHKFGYT